MLKIFRLEYDGEDGRMRFILINQMPEFDTSITTKPALALLFSPDSHKLVAA